MRRGGAIYIEFKQEDIRVKDRLETKGDDKLRISEHDVEEEQEDHMSNDKMQRRRAIMLVLNFS